MTPPYDNRGPPRRRNDVWSHWVPLVVTVTIATVGFAAWAWSQRNDHDEEEEDEDEDEEEHVVTQHLDNKNVDYGDNSAYGSHGNGASARDLPSFGSDLGLDEVGHGVNQTDKTGSSWGARMSGALRRTPSPQNILDRAGKTVAASVAAAGTAVGSALAAIREDDKSTFADHDTWSEEADLKKGNKSASQACEIGSKKRESVAIVVSADTQLEFDQEGYHGHASILSHIPKHNDFSKIKLFILIYAPSLKGTIAETTGNRPPASLSSSFSVVGHEQAQTPGDEANGPLMSQSTHSAFNVIYSQALGLVEKEINVLPFTTPTGYTHILHHLQPKTVYLQESLAGRNGVDVQKLQTWFRYDIILVVGADSGHGGLADSESEAERAGQEIKWWQEEDRVGRGRGVVVVDGMRINDDWARRVQRNE